MKECLCIKIFSSERWKHQSRCLLCIMNMIVLWKNQSVWARTKTALFHSVKNELHRPRSKSWYASKYTFFIWRETRKGISDIFVSSSYILVPKETLRAKQKVPDRLNKLVVQSIQIHLHCLLSLKEWPNSSNVLTFCIMSKKWGRWMSLAVA